MYGMHPCFLYIRISLIGQAFEHVKKHGSDFCCLLHTKRKAVIHHKLMGFTDFEPQVMVIAQCDEDFH